MKSTKVAINDNYNKRMKDKFGVPKNTLRGHVCIYDKNTGELIEKSDQVEFPGIKLHDGPNLIVYTGRSWLMQRAFNQDHILDSGVRNTFISWFGLGTGGASGADPLNPVAPIVTDSVLSSPIVINSTDAVCTNSGKLHPIVVDYTTDSSNLDEYLIAKVTTEISNDDANGAAGNTFFDLSEAGLYISQSADAATVDANTAYLQLFARVTFSTIRKHDEREITFVWSIYF